MVDNKLAPVVEESQKITADKIKRFLPTGSSQRLTDELIEEINEAGEEAGICQNYYEEKLMGSLHMLKKSGHSVKQLSDAIKYVTLQQDYTNEQAYEIVFPAKISKWREEGKFIASRVSSYNKGDLVVEVAKNCMIQVQVSYQNELHKSIVSLVNLRDGRDANGRPTSGQVQMSSAIALVEKLTMPEDNTINIKMGLDDESKSIQQNLFEQLAESSRIARDGLLAGRNIGDVQKVNIRVNQDTEEIIDV